MLKSSRIWLYAVYFVVLAVLAGFIIASSHSTTPKAAKTKPPAKTQPHVPVQTKTSPVSSQPKPLTDTGPGDYIGLFVTGTVTGTAFYQWRQRRKLAA